MIGYFPRNCIQANAIETQQRIVNTYSGNGLMPSGTKPLPEPMLTQIYDTIWCHKATVS